MISSFDNAIFVIRPRGLCPRARARFFQKAGQKFNENRALRDFVAKRLYYSGNWETIQITEKKS